MTLSLGVLIATSLSISSTFFKSLLWEQLLTFMCQLKFMKMRHYSHFSSCKLSQSVGCCAWRVIRWWIEVQTNASWLWDRHCLWHQVLLPRGPSSSDKSHLYTPDKIQKGHIREKVLTSPVLVALVLNVFLNRAIETLFLAAVFGGLIWGLWARLGKRSSSTGILRFPVNLH